MADKSKKTPHPGRWNILIMRPKGEVTNMTISPWFLVLGFLFALAFAAVSVVIINRYFALYLEYETLAEDYQKASEALDRLRNIYAYQTMVDDDYARLVSSVIQSDSASTDEEAAEAGDDFIALGSMTRLDRPEPAGNDVPGTDESGRSLAGWAALLPDPTDPPTQKLDASDLRVSGGNFRFQLSNQSEDGMQARGRVLMLFAVAHEGRLTLLTYPEFDLESDAPDFAAGPGYTIRSSKPVAGRIRLPKGGRIVEMMVIAQSRDGEIVLKKAVAPEE